MLLAVQWLVDHSQRWHHIEAGGYCSVLEVSGTKKVFLLDFLFVKTDDALHYHYVIINAAIINMLIIAIKIIKYLLYFTPIDMMILCFLATLVALVSKLVN